MCSDDSKLDVSSIKKDNFHTMPKGNILEDTQFQPAIQEDAKRVDVSSSKVLKVNVLVPSAGELDMLKADDVGDQDGCTTPRDQVMINVCPPPAPRKPKSLPSKKRKMEDKSDELAVSIQVSHKEVQLLLFAQDFFCANMVKNKARKLI